MDEWINKMRCIYTMGYSVWFSSVHFSRSVVSDSLRPHESQHARPRCPSPTPGVHWDSCPSSQWCHPAISSSVVPFSSCPQSLPESESFPMSQLFSWGGQSTGVSALASYYSVIKKKLWDSSIWNMDISWKYWICQTVHLDFCSILEKNPNELFCQSNIMLCDMSEKNKYAWFYSYIKSKKNGKTKTDT